MSTDDGESVVENSDYEEKEEEEVEEEVSSGAETPRKANVKRSEFDAFKSGVRSEFVALKSDVRSEFDDLKCDVRSLTHSVSVLTDDIRAFTQDRQQHDSAAGARRGAIGARDSSVGAGTRRAVGMRDSSVGAGTRMPEFSVGMTSATGNSSSHVRNTPSGDFANRSYAVGDHVDVQMKIAEKYAGELRIRNLYNPKTRAHMVISGGEIQHTSKDSMKDHLHDVVRVTDNVYKQLDGNTGFDFL